MTKGMLFRILALVFLAFALLQAFLRFGDYRDGEISTFVYALNIGGPLIMSIAMQIFARQFGSSDGGDS